MMKFIYKVIFAIPILCTLIVTVLFIFLGVLDIAKGVYGIALGQMHTNLRPGLKIVEALDLFLLGYLFFIFSVGFSQLFFPEESRLAKLIKGITPKLAKAQSIYGIEVDSLGYHNDSIGDKICR